MKYLYALQYFANPKEDAHLPAFVEVLNPIHNGEAVCVRDSKGTLRSFLVSVVTHVAYSQESSTSLLLVETK